MTALEFSELRYGMFVHYGLFSRLARGEWVMNREQIPPEEMRRLAQQCAAKAVAMTFDPHPRSVLSPDAAPQLLIPLEERCRRLRDAGADEVRIIPFTRELAALPLEAFLDSLLAEEEKLAKRQTAQV